MVLCLVVPDAALSPGRVCSSQSLLTLSLSLLLSLSSLSLSSLSLSLSLSEAASVSKGKRPSWQQYGDPSISRHVKCLAVFPTERRDLSLLCVCVCALKIARDFWRCVCFGDVLRRMDQLTDFLAGVGLFSAAFIRLFHRQKVVKKGAEEEEDRDHAQHFLQQLTHWRVKIKGGKFVRSWKHKCVIICTLLIEKPKRFAKENLFLAFCSIDPSFN